MAEYIEREALLELYENTPDCNIDNLSVPVEVVRQNIKDMPTADVAPVVHAYWKWNGKHWECSNCGNERFHDLVLGLDAAFCPHCGAFMEEKTNDCKRS